MSKKRNRTKLKVTSAEQWKALRRDGVLVTLPSGFTARLRPVGIMELVQTGKIPDTLTPIAAEALAQGRPSTEIIKEQFTATAEFMSAVCCSAMLDPQVAASENGDVPDGCISFYDICLEDQLFILDFVGAPTRNLEPFRQQQARDVEAVPDGEDVPDEAE